MMMALGFIETKGLIGAIEAADAMLKAADVRLLEKNLAGGGLVTITVTGEVAAVQSSVDAAAAAIARIAGTVLVSRHVIARPDTELAHILKVEPSGKKEEVPAVSACQNNGSKNAQSDKKPEEVQKASSPADVAPVQEPASAVSAKSDNGQARQAETPRHSHAQLKKMTVSKVRQIAENLQVQIPGSDIATADKKALIEAIMTAYRQIEE